MRDRVALVHTAADGVRRCVALSAPPPHGAVRLLRCDAPAWCHSGQCAFDLLPVPL